MKKSKTINATATRNFLAFFMVIVIIGAAAGFYFGLGIIKKYSLEVSHAVSDSNASGQNIEQLGVLKQELAQREPLVTKANQLFTTEVAYQSQVLKDIQQYASASGVVISNTEFNKSSAVKEVSPAAADPAGTNPAGSSPTKANPAVASPAEAHSAVVTVQSPVSYSKLLKFLNAIEGNLPKMQITGISISRPTATSGDTIVTDKITITVATR